MWTALFSIVPRHSPSYTFFRFLQWPSMSPSGTRKGLLESGCSRCATLRKHSRNVQQHGMGRVKRTYVVALLTICHFPFKDLFVVGVRYSWPRCCCDTSLSGQRPWSTFNYCTRRIEYFFRVRCSVAKYTRYFGTSSRHFPYCIKQFFHLRHTFGI